MSRNDRARQLAEQRRETESQGTPDANDQFATAADDFQQKFLKELNLTEVEHTAIYGSGLRGFLGFGTEAGGKEAFRSEVLGTRDTNTVLDAIAKADPSTASLMAKLKSEPELAEAFKTALVKDPSMLDGLATMRDPNSSEINMADIEKTLENPQAVAAMTNLLEKVADGSTVPGTNTDVSFTHVQDILTRYKKDGVKGAVIAMQETGVDLPAGEMSGEILMQFFSDLMEDPSMAVNNLMETMVEFGQMDIDQANMLKGFMEPFAGFAKFSAEPYVEYAQKYGLTPSKFQETVAAKKEDLQERGEELADKYGSNDRPGQEEYQAALKSAQAQTDKGVSVEQTGVDHTQTASLTDSNTFGSSVVGTSDVTQDPAFGGTDPAVSANTAKPATLDAA